ncbi:MAG TPA: hypothetical protein VH044_10730 [Polyangiaceae bacterium]|jgi:hypothetical protein|nr:hypothetical protein [Polyangiaceae bacterium]
MELKNLIETHLDLPKLSSVLDELGPPGRLWSVQQWTRGNLAVLWEAAKGFRPLTLDDLVPPSIAPLSEVVHHGKNSLPVFSHFRKHFCRPAPAPASGASGEGSGDAPVESAAELVGYNEQATGAFTGPGYYVARASAESGAVDFDYTKTPAQKAASWPPLAPSSARLGRFVYAGAVDLVRSISSHVCVGRVRKNGRDEDVWFVLVREDREEGGSGEGSGEGSS